MFEPESNRAQFQNRHAMLTTALSVNINKVALLRNSRGRNFPDVRDFATRCLDYGAKGITLHPRPDQRHARYSDIADLKALCVERKVELNVEGYPADEFLNAVIAARPDQCTLVPDAPGQLTSDHGWAIQENEALLRQVVRRLHDHGIRVSLFLDPGSAELDAVVDVGADRIELYTESYASAFHTPEKTRVLECFRVTAAEATRAGLGVNAGHDLSIENLAEFLTIPAIREVSIGHALIVESLHVGLRGVIERYQEILRKSESA